MIQNVGLEIGHFAVRILAPQPTSRDAALFEFGSCLWVANSSLQRGNRLKISLTI
jgi:hypothetical protein